MFKNRESMKLSNTFGACMKIREMQFIKFNP